MYRENIVRKFPSLSETRNNFFTREKSVSSEGNLERLYHAFTSIGKISIRTKAHLHDMIWPRIRLFVLTHPINSLESSGRIATLASESNAGTMPLRQHYISQDEQLYRTVVSCKWALK